MNTPLSSGSEAESRVFHTLDALRGIAAIGVVIFHMGGAFSPLALPGGYLAVDLFFMMSGVVLSNAYEARFRAGMGTLEFMRARLIRLYPLYLLGTLFAIAVTLASLLGRNSQNWDMPSLLQAASLAILFMPSFSASPVDQLFPLNIPSWSLFLEILVNLLFVASWKLLTSRRLIAVSAVSAMVIGTMTAYHGNIDQGSSAASLATGLARTIFGFAIGVLIARNIRHFTRGRSNLAVLAITAIFCAAVAGSPEGDLRVIWDVACVLIVFPLLVFFGTIVDPTIRLRRIATFLGVTSYAIYVLHGPFIPVLNSVTRALASSGAIISPPWLGISVLVGLLTACWLIDRHYDLPIRGTLSRLIPRPKRRAVAQPEV